MQTRSNVPDPSETAGSPVPWRRTAILYCVAGIWTDDWWGNPAAWQSWACAFHDWGEAEWQQFAALWAWARRLAPRDADRVRAALMAAYRVYFYNWRRTPGGSTHGDVRQAAWHVRSDLQTLRNVVLVGHSKGGAVIKHLLGADWPWGAGTRPLGVIFLDAPLDLLRELVGAALRWGLRPTPRWRPPADVPCLTINNWLDLSGGRLRGVENIQVWLWNDYLQPYPPHGMKSRQAPEAIRCLRALIHAQHSRSAPHPPAPGPSPSDSEGACNG